MANAHSSIRDMFNTKILSTTEIYQNVRNRLRISNSQEENFENLESYLNAVFYPIQNNSSSAMLNRIQNFIVKEINDSVDSTFNSYNFETNTFGSSNSAYQLGVNARERGTHKEGGYMKMSTIKARLNSLTAFRDKIRTEKDATDMVVKMNELITLLKNSLIDGEFSDIVDKKGDVVDTKVSFGGNDIMRRQLQRIDELWQQITYINDLPDQRHGLFFEQALQLLGSGVQNLEELQEEKLFEIFTKETAGSKLVGRGSLNMSTSVNGIDIKAIPNKNNSISYRVEGKNGSYFNMTGTFSDREGKSDVIFQLPNPNGSGPAIDFRVSAKNWSTINSNHDFGETALLSAILRTTGDLDKALAYGIQIGWYAQKNNGPALQNARNYAKLCAIADILIGYSQTTGYANTLVINDRARQHVYVYSMNSILNNFDQIIKSNRGFSESNIYSGITDFKTHLNIQFQSILEGMQAHKIKLLATILDRPNPII